MFENPEAVEVALVAGGTITAGALISLMIQAIKDFIPNLRGIWALIMVYAVAAITATTILINVDVGSAPTEMLVTSWFVLWLNLSVVARGTYATFFRSKHPEE